MTTQAPVSDVLSERFLVRIYNEIQIAAPLATTFEAILEQIGPGLDRPDGVAMPMKLDAWPGGRYYRDTGNNTGHFWGHVQVIKPPTLLEITGPMFMSYPILSHVQYRLVEDGVGTLLKFTHRLFGDVSAEHRSGMTQGWGHILNGIKRRATK
jgi:hypothetical protein